MQDEMRFSFLFFSSDSAFSSLFALSRVVALTVHKKVGYNGFHFIRPNVDERFDNCVRDENNLAKEVSKVFSHFGN